MAKSGRNSGKQKQDQVIAQFSKDIYQHEKRTWLTISERAILEGEKRRVAKTEQVRISHYNPSNPMNGSSNWTKEQHQAFRQSQKAKK
jgi:hypothetical protein